MSNTREDLEELRRGIAALPKPQREKIERLAKSLRGLVNLYGHDGMIAALDRNARSLARERAAERPGE